MAKTSHSFGFLRQHLNDLLEAHPEEEGGGYVARSGGYCNRCSDPIQLHDYHFLFQLDEYVKCDNKMSR